MANFSRHSGRSRLIYSPVASTHLYAGLPKSSAFLCLSSDCPRLSHCDGQSASRHDRDGSRSYQTQDRDGTYRDRDTGRVPHLSLTASLDTGECNPTSSFTTFTLRLRNSSKSARYDDLRRQRGRYGLEGILSVTEFLRQRPNGTYKPQGIWHERGKGSTYCIGVPVELPETKSRI
jgi:hypothetical protein